MIYKIETKIVTDLLPRPMSFVDFLIVGSKALLLEHEEPGVFYVSLLFRCRQQKRVNVSLFFHDAELNYVYRVDKHLQPPVTSQIPVYFDYPYHIDNPVMIVVTVTEIDMIKSSLIS
jgi:hypothetical protein